MHIEHDFNELVSQPSALDEIIATAQENWAKVFDVPSISQKLSEYIDRGGKRDAASLAKTPELKAMHAEFKQLRKAGLMLSAVYVLVDKTHTCPSELDTFLTRLGEFVDAFWTPTAAHPTILYLRTKMSTFVSKDFAAGIQPDSAPSIQQYAHHRLEKLRAGLSDPETKADALHSFRKKLRLFTRIFTLATQKNTSASLHEAWQTLVEINDELEALNDVPRKKTLQEMRVPSKLEITIPDELKQRLLNLLSQPAAPAGTNSAPVESNP